ncbi:MAG: thiamine phosphate synthase [Candidatus Eisenbacteria bacterium]|uniref:Thiamine-phosphate synthase n=1 Tax=Eiseniibacteriota bacterium TaxID=2212470 RepID=A0A7Y2E9B2_UNCEI|nr:thiamine phosphate synthase [Candidatus Eisenbacteria bacterium]
MIEGLILITDRRQVRTSIETCAQAALAAGFSAVMLREKDLATRDLFELAKTLKSYCDKENKPLLINDRMDITLALGGATGLHVGSHGVPLADLTPRAFDGLLGYSSHSPKEAQKALSLGADYITVSPIYKTLSKPELQPKGLGLLEETLKLCPVSRVFALGGVTEENLPGIANSGAAGAAIMGEMMRSPKPDKTAARLMEAWSGSHKEFVATRGQH